MSADDFKGRRWSCRASEFRKVWTRAKQAMEAFSIGMVRIMVFIGPCNNEIKDNPVNAAEVSNVLPVILAERTNTMNVINGASINVLLATGIVSSATKFSSSPKSYQGKRGSRAVSGIGLKEPILVYATLESYPSACQ